MLKIRVTAEPATIEVDPEDYREAWEEYCQETEQTSLEDFVLSKVDEEIEDGTRDLAVVLESSIVRVELADE